jgi:hypothetical protein
MPPVRSLRRIAQTLAAVCLVLLVVMAGRPFFTNASRPARGIGDPQIALQMAKNANEIDAIFADVPSPDREAMRIKQYIDFAFIGAYSLLAVVLSEILARTSKAGRLVGLFAIVGALFDARENSIILRIIDTPLASTTQAMIGALHSASVSKWAFTLAAVATLSLYWLTNPRWFMRVIGGVELAGALLAGAGLRENALLPWAAALMATGILLNAATLKFLTHESFTPDPIPRSV